MVFRGILNESKGWWTPTDSHEQIVFRWDIPEHKYAWIVINFDTTLSSVTIRTVLDTVTESGFYVDGIHIILEDDVPVGTPSSDAQRFWIDSILKVLSDFHAKINSNG